MNQKPVLDLTRTHFVRPIGDLVCIGSWVFNADQEDYEPCLVVVPRYRKEGFKPCIVALSSSWKYNPEHGGAANIWRSAKEFVFHLGMEDTPKNIYSVADLINSHLGDLIAMPPSPTRSIVVADASVSIDGVKRSIELIDYQPLAQA